MATKSDFIVKSGIRVAANATVSGAASISGNLTIAPTAALIVNSSSGTIGQVLTSNGTAVYWANAEAGVNTDARYTWTNTHTFQSVVTFGNTSINSTINSTILSIQSVSANLTGNVVGNVVATTLSGNLTGNVVGNVVATTLSGNLTGNVAAVTITGNLTGNVVATSVNATTINATANVVVGANVLINTSTISVGNSTVKTTINTTAFSGNIVATTLSGNLTGNVAATTISGNLTGNVVATTISGNLTAVTANVTNKIQVGIPGAFDFGSNAVIEIDANGNTYVQSVIQNANTGNNASADLVVTNDTGNDSFNYVDLGINGSNYNQPGYSISGQNDAYLYASDGNLTIGTRAAKEVVFHANGTTATDRRFTINATALTIANAAALVANGSTGTAAQILTSNGTGVYWSSSANNADNLGGVAAASYQLNSTLNANIAAYLPTYTGVVNAATFQVGTAFKANTTDVVTANLTVQGNLVVTGTTVTLNTATLDVKDLNITVAKGVPSAAAANGAGITVDVANAEIVYVNAGNTWLSNINFGVGNSTSNVSINSTAFIGNVVATAITGNLTGNVTAVTISGNLTGNVAAVTISGNLTGNVAAVTITGNLTGNVVAGTVNATTINATSSIVVGANVLVNTSILAIGNSTANVYVNSTAFVGNTVGVHTGNVVATTITGNLTGNVSSTTLSASANINLGATVVANTTGTYATHLGGTAAASYVQNTDSRTLSGNLNFTGVNTYFQGSTLGTTSGNIANNITLFNSVGNNGGHFRFYTDRNATGSDWTTASAKLQWRIDATDMGYIEFNPPDASGITSGRGIAFGGNEGTEAMRVTSTGNVGIGNTAPAHKLSVNGTTNLAGAVTGITTLAAGNTTISGFINSTSTGQFGGEVTAVDFNSTSDARFKSDIVVIENALDKVNNLSGYTFVLNETGERSTGLIAQEVEKVLPEAVRGNSEKKTLSYGNMIGLLVEAIKEQNKKIERLESLLNK